MGISVVIPCFNAGSDVVKTIDALLAQSLRPDEIVVVDDGSTDGSRCLLEGYGEQVRVLRQKNQGAARARFTGVLGASHDIIVFNDAGDISEVNRLQLFAASFAEHKDVVACYARTTLVAKGELSKRPPMEGGKVPSVVLAPLDLMIGQSWPLAIGMNFAIRREIAVQCADVPSFFRAANDYALQIRAASLGSFGYIDEPTLRYEATVGGISQKNGLLKQNAFALVAAHDVLCKAGNVGKLREVFNRRLNSEGGKLLAEMLIRREYSLFLMILKIVARLGNWGTALRQSWWHLDEQEQLGRFGPQWLKRIPIRLVRTLLR